MTKFKGCLNSLDHVLHVLEENKEYDPNSSFGELEQDWQCLISNRADKYPDSICIDEEIHDNCLSTIMGNIRLGEYPAPELLVTLLEAYDEYIKQRGSMSLEEAFFGKPKKNSGSFSARKFKQKKVDDLSLKMSFEELNVMLGNNKKSKIKITEEFIKENKLSDQPEHLLRMYYRNSDK